MARAFHLLFGVVAYPVFFAAILYLIAIVGSLPLGPGTGEDFGAIVEARGLRQTSDTGAIEAAIGEVIAANHDKVAEYRLGKDKLFGFFVGQVMCATAGRANPGVVNELLKKALG